MTNQHLKSPPTPLSALKLYVIGFALIVLWGSAFTMISVGVTLMPAIWLVALRCIFAAICVSLYAYLRGHRFPSLRDERWLWYFSLAMTGIVLPFFCTAVGQKTVSGGLSAILVGAMPLITIILAHFFANEPLSWRKGLGFLIGFGGIILLFLPSDFGFSLITNWRAQSLLLLAAMFYAITTVAAKHAPETAPSLGAAMMTLSGAIASLVWALFTGLPETPIPLEGWILVIALAVGSTAVGTILYLYVVNEAGPTVMARINYFPPVAAVFFGTLILDEPFTIRIAAAFFIILAGVIISRSETTGSADVEKS